MPDDPPVDAALARARLRGKRVALGVVLVIAVVFIGASAWNIVPAVFGANVHPLPSGPAGSPERACADGVRRLERSLPQWQDAAGVQSECAKSSAGLDAWASLLRLRMAAQQLGDADLAPLRQDVETHLPGDLR
jgi:hypothetical protein